MLVTDVAALSKALVEAEEAEAKLDHERRLSEMKAWADFASSLVAAQTNAIQRAVLRASAGGLRLG